MKSPIKNFSSKKYPEGNITQYFGVNAKLYAHLNMDGHNGWDIVAPWGTPIFAVSDQKIVEVKDTPNGYGKHIRAIDDEHEYTYGHLSSISVTIGQTVKAGDEIGKCGNTGFVVSGATPFWQYNPYAGTHLHITIRKIRRWEGTGQYNLQYQTMDKVWVENHDNGFFGAIDPEQFSWDETPPQITGLQLTVISLANQVISLQRKLLELLKLGRK